MKISRTEDNLVGKYLHDDGSETAIKSLSSCDTVRDPITGKLYRNPVERHKFSVFLSGSAGCYMRCAFCYLTLKQAPYGRLDGDKIFANAIEAVRAERLANPGIAERYAKLCWMGMGEDHLLHPERTREVTLRLLCAMEDEGHALGLDGCDIATVLPLGINDDRWIAALGQLNADLAAFPANPHNKLVVHTSNDAPDYETRTRVRLFWSLHSAVAATRDRLIPNARGLAASAATLRRMRKEAGIDLIIHHLFLEGSTDTEVEVDALCDFLDAEGLSDAELRILRYNPFESAVVREAPNFDSLAERVAARLARVKVQISTGVEVTAACGQFIVRDFVEGREAQAAIVA